MNRTVVQELVKLADSLDKRGLRKESDMVDRILKTALEPGYESGAGFCDECDAKGSDDIKISSKKELLDYKKRRSPLSEFIWVTPAGNLCEKCLEKTPWWTEQA